MVLLPYPQEITHYPSNAAEQQKFEKCDYFDGVFNLLLLITALFFFVANYEWLRTVIILTFKGRAFSYVNM